MALGDLDVDGNGIKGTFNEMGIGAWDELKWLRLEDQGSWKTLVGFWVPLKA
jgi:hypothetical protein